MLFLYYNERVYMNNDIDVIHELEVKNREIYLNKLNIDLDNNNEILLITMNNIIDLSEQELIRKILEIESSNMNKDNISNAVNIFYSNIKVKINELLKIRNNYLKNVIINIENIDYKEEMDSELIKFIESIKNIYNTNTLSLIKKINNDDEFINNRIEEYIKVLNYDKLISKINECFTNMNNILYNNYLEGTSKYQKLNEKTLK